jgi:hypothetical protein
MKVYITKYLFTAGILELEAEMPYEACPTMVTVRKGGKFSLDQYFHKPYWHETREAAVKQAMELREKKLKSLKKQLKKIESLVIQ